MYKILVPFLVSAGLVISPQIWAEPTPRWTLGASIQRALEVAPEIKIVDAEIGKQQGKLEQADTWPNPSISIQVDDTLGLDDASGGYDVSEFAISQSLPFGRLGHQLRQAEAEVASAQAQHVYQQLLLEYRVAQRLHVLQLAEARLQLATKRLQQAGLYQNTGNKRRNGDHLIRYLTPLEIMRLDIVLQAAKQTLEVAEGEYNEAAASFKDLLEIPVEEPLNLIPLAPVPVPQEFNALENNLQDHPALEVNKQIIESSRAGVAVAKAQRFSDPTLTVFRGEEYIDNRRQGTTGIMLNIEIPLWNQGKGRVTQARYEVHQAQADMSLRQRELQTNLHKSYLHLDHLIKQAEHYHSNLLAPAQQMFSLTRKGFDAGEINILTLIDANNTYFDAQERYLELLQEGWLELAEVRKSSGLFLADKRPVIQFGEVK